MFDLLQCFFRCYGTYVAERLTLFPCRSKLISDKSPVPIFCVFRAVLATKIDLQVAIFPRVPASRLICSEDPTRVMCPEIQKHTSYLSLLKSHLIFATKHHNKHWGFSSASGIMCTLHICIDSKNQISTICTKVQVVQQVYAQKYENNNTCNLI